MKKESSRFRCRQEGCPNVYDEVLGGDMAFGKHPKGECVPCGIAAEMIRNNQTPEQIEAVPQMVGLMLSFLESTGWTWGHVKESIKRKPVIF